MHPPHAHHHPARHTLRNIAATLAVALSTSCAHTADPADINELATILKSNNNPLGIQLTNQQATCLAQLYLESGLSHTAINNLKNGQPLAPATNNDLEAIEHINAHTLDCT